MGRPKKTADEHKKNGTFRADRYGELEKTEKTLQAIPTKPLRVPKIITDKSIRKIYKQHIELLRSINMEQISDSPELEFAYICLQKAKEIQCVFLDTNPLNKEFDSIQKTYFRLYKQYCQIVSKYFVSPQSRLRLTLDALAAKKTQQDIEKTEETATEKLLRRKKS